MKPLATAATPGLFLAAFLGIGILHPTARAGIDPTLDFGDAPDSPYPTLLASDGARHTGTGPMLGGSRDLESDGQPTTRASGDDAAGPASDDEDGIVFSTILFPGFATNPVTVSVSGAAPGGALLSAWMDFNGDGDWTDPGEEIFTDTVVFNGPNSLTFAVPAVALAKTVYSRWRISTAGGLTYSGPAADGEVEDYCHGSIHGRKWIDQNGNGRPDPGEPGLNGQRIELLDSTGTTLLGYVATHDIDLDGTPGINPATESGLYGIHGVPDGDYVLRDLPDPNVRRTFPLGFTGEALHRVRVACAPLGRTPPEQPPVCGNVFNWVEFCPPGTEQWFSVWIFTVRPAGSPSSPTTSLVGTGDTILQRGPVMDPGVGTAHIETEIVALDLVGTHPYLGGYQISDWNAPGGSRVEIFEHTELESPDSFYQVDSFFDVWTEISFDVGASWVPSSGPPRLEATGGIDEVPPIGSHFAWEGETELTVVGTDDYDLLGIEMVPLHGVDFGVEITNAKRKADLRRTIRNLQAKLKKQRAKILQARRKQQAASLRRLLAEQRRLTTALRAANRNLGSL